MILGSLIGLNLTNIENIGNEEVNEFRWNMKVFAADIVHAREEAFKEDKLNILEYQFPPVINNYSCNIDNRKVEIVVNFENQLLSFEIEADKLPSEIIKIAKQKLNVKKSDSILCLKIYGREEYLIKELPLSQYKFIYGDDSENKKIYLVLKDIDSVVMKLKKNGDLMKIREGSKKPRRGSTAFRRTIEMREKQILQNETVSSIRMEDTFKIGIGQLKHITICQCKCNDVSLWMKIGIYHGSQEIVESQNFKVDDIMVKDQCENNGKTSSKTLDFKISVKKIPRNARLCFGIYLKDSKPKEKIKFIGWANITIFNFKGQMKNTCSVSFWESADEVPTHDLLSPYKTIAEEYDRRNSNISFDITFFNTFGCSVLFPEETKLDWKNPNKSKPDTALRRKTMNVYSEVYTENML